MIAADIHASETTAPAHGTLASPLAPVRGIALAVVAGALAWVPVIAAASQIFGRNLQH